MFSMSAKRSVNIVVTPEFVQQQTPSPPPEEGTVVVDASFNVLPAAFSSISTSLHRPDSNISA